MSTIPLIKWLFKKYILTYYIIFQAAAGEIYWNPTSLILYNSIKLVGIYSHHFGAKRRARAFAGLARESWHLNTKRES